MRVSSLFMALAAVSPALALPLTFQHAIKSSDLPTSLDAFALADLVDAHVAHAAAFAPLTCMDANADLPAKMELPVLGFPVTNVTVVDVETKGRAIGNVSVKAVEVDAKADEGDPSIPTDPTDPSDPTEPSPLIPSNITFLTSLSASTPALLAQLLLSPPTILFDPLTGILTYNLTTPTKFLVPTDCAIVKVTVTVPRTEVAPALKVRAAMQGVDVTGTGGVSTHTTDDDDDEDDSGFDFASLDLMSVFGNVGATNARVNTTVKILGVNGAASGSGLHVGGNVTYTATRGAITLSDSHVHGNVSLTSILAPVTASGVSFNGSFNCSSRMAGASATGITILRDETYPLNATLSVWSVLAPALLTVTNPFSGTFNLSSGFTSVPTVEDADGLAVVTPGLYPAKVTGTRGVGGDWAEVSSKVGGSALKFGV